MIALPRRAFTLGTIACLIIALATLGGYWLASSSSPSQGHARLATFYADTYVSGTGDDTKNGVGCPRITPCQSFYGAYVVTAAGGQINAIDSGNFSGLGIGQALTIDGGPGRALIRTNGLDGIGVNAGPNDVVILRHLQIRYVGTASGLNGIQFNSGKALILDDVTIEGYPGHGLFVDTAGPASVTITNSRIQNNGQAGIAIAPSSGTVQVTISHSQLARNYYGIIAQDGADVSLTDSVVSGSTNVGVGCQTYGNGPCTIQTAHDRLDHNWAAIWMSHGAGAGQITETLSDNDVYSNTYGIYGDFGGTLNAATFGNNRFVNNFVDGVASSTMSQK